MCIPKYIILHIDHTWGVTAKCIQQVCQVESFTHQSDHKEDQTLFHYFVIVFRKFVFKSLHKLYTVESKSALSSGDSLEQSENLQKKTRLECHSQILEQKEIESVEKKFLKSNNVTQKQLGQNYLDWIQKAIVKV